MQTGKPTPWPVVRRWLAERWHIRPWEVGDVPVDEITLELFLMGLDAQYPPKQDR